MPTMRSCDFDDEQRRERLALEPQNPGFVDQATRVDVAACQHRGDGFAEMQVVLGDEPALPQVDEPFLAIVAMPLRS